MKKGILLIIGIAILCINLAFAEDYCFASLGKGEKTSDDYYTCGHTICQVCTVAATKAYATWNKCSSVCPADTVQPQELSLSVVWPFSNGGIYTKQSFFMDITTNQISSIKLIDNFAGTQRNLCPNCNSYKKSMTFKQGLNDITILAVKGLSVKESRITFFIDNKKPVISKTLPLPNKYAGTVFTVFYNEDNVKEVKLKYGNNVTGMREAILSGCGNGKKNCSIDIDLGDYDSEIVEYWFEIKDIADTVTLSKKTKFNVDETLPAIDFFNYDISTAKKYVNVKTNITEANFFKVEYMDDAELKPKWKTVCSSLKNKKTCEKKIYLKIGAHKLNFRISDKAGNYAFYRIPDFSI